MEEFFVFHLAKVQAEHLLKRCAIFREMAFSYVPIALFDDDAQSCFEVLFNQFLEETNWAKAEWEKSGLSFEDLVTAMSRTNTIPTTRADVYEMWRPGRV
jgi:hypothetical protein